MQHRQDRFLDAVPLDLDVKVRPVVDQGEDFRKCGNVLSLASIKIPEICQHRLIHHPRAVRGAMQGAVVQNHGDAFGGGMEIKLDAIHSQVERLAEGQQCVLRPSSGIAAVCIDACHTKSSVIAPAQAVIRLQKVDTNRINLYHIADITRAGGTVMNDPGCEPVFIISVAARLLEMHPQTLRKYEREGLIAPSRTTGNLRLYSDEDLERLRQVKYLVGEQGLNLAGVQLVLDITRRLQAMHARASEEAIAGDDPAMARLQAELAALVRGLGGSVRNT